MSARAAVEDVVRTYFDGLFFADVNRLASVFHPRAVYATADETPALIRSMDEYFRVVADRRSPASRGETRRDQVDSIEFAGPNTALARVRCSIADRDFVDLLSLVRVDDRWQIIAKVFQINERPGRTQEVS